MKNMIFLLYLIISLTGCNRHYDTELFDLRSRVTHLQAELDEIKNNEIDAEQSYDHSASLLSASLLSESDIMWYEFFVSDQYWWLHQTAYRFLRAFYHADSEAMKQLAADPDADWLSLLPTTERTLDNVTKYVFSVNRHVGTIEYYENAGEYVRVVHSYISVADLMQESDYLIHLYTIYINNEWKIINVEGDS